ncbi:MAG: hypothetical protein JWN53_1567 [Gemmatimonadetes bacterium]|nr:hypothetical protein [Gemmatimonadota bacterium]
MRYTIRHTLFGVAALSLLAVSPLLAQDTAHKPGGLNKVAHDVSNTVKKAGRDTKAEVKRDASNTHATLQKTGNDTKGVLKKTTGIHGSNSQNPGGLNKVARDISKTGKKAARDTRAEKDRDKSKAHGALTETGKSIKDTTLKGKP